MAKSRNRKSIKNSAFPELPEFPGGKRGFLEYIKTNLRYPEEALKNNIEGTVHLNFTINQDGIVEHCVVTKGIGYGCDEEAVRLIKEAKYGRAHNRGFKITTTRKTRIAFSIKKIKKTISYSYTSKDIKDQETSTKPTVAGQPQVYEYSVRIGKKL